jgi:hypothetical protein
LQAELFFEAPTMKGRLYIALLHHPVLDREGRVITSAVTNADIHDIARSAKTYGVRRVFIATPISEQADLVRKIIGHWTCGAGGALNPSRREALEAVEVAGTLEEVIEAISRDESCPVNIVVTGARLGGSCVSHAQFREILENGHGPTLFVFGTGWGLAGEVIECSRYRLEPINGPGPYNHLSVRSAVAITLDRLVGRKNGS